MVNEMFASTEWVDRSRRYLRKRGLLSFCFAAVDVALPEPLGTRFRARRKIFFDAFSPAASIPLGDRIQMVRHGFPPKLFYLYGLDGDEDPNLYLDDVARREAKYINDRYEWLDDKQKFYAYLRTCGWGAFLPTVYGRIANGRFRSEQYSSLAEVLHEQDPVVIKRRRGAAGNNVYICTDEDASLDSSDPHHIHLDETALTEFGNHLVTEYCSQAGYAERIYPNAANTVRLLTVRTDEGVRIPAAAHRIGSASTGVLDNFSQGGLSAAIDTSTGELSPAVEPSASGPQWHDRHPNTDELIAGVTIPGWATIRETIRKIASDTSAFDYVGWDLIVTAPGEFRIIEANSYPDPDLFQVHEPVLANESIRRFYQEHDII